MQVILHTGVHKTDESRLLRCLRRNGDAFWKEGIYTPERQKFGTFLTDTVNQLGNAPLPPDTREIVLDAILEDAPEGVERLVLSHEHFFSVPKLALHHGRFYFRAESRLNTFCRIFDRDEVELFIGLRNPATFLPEVFASSPAVQFQNFMGDVNPLHLRWSDLILRIKEQNPNLPITVWANEDTPLIWGQIVREMAGIELNRKILGAFDMFSQIISSEGMKRFRGFLKENPGINEIQKRRVMSAFLDKFALEDQIEEELQYTDWDGPFVDLMTTQYDEDVDMIASIPGVTLISP
jgi:hypothetical protein